MLARFFRQQDGLGRKVRAIHRTLVFASSVAAGALIATGPAIIALLYDERYHGAGPILGLLAVGAWLQAFTASYYAVILAAGKPAHNGFGMATRLAIIASLSGAAFRHFGALGIAGLASLSELGVSAFCFYARPAAGARLPVDRPPGRRPGCRDLLGLPIAPRHPVLTRPPSDRGPPPMPVRLARPEPSPDIPTPAPRIGGRPPPAGGGRAKRARPLGGPTSPSSTACAGRPSCSS